LWGGYFINQRCDFGINIQEIPEQKETGFKREEVESQPSTKPRRMEEVDQNCRTHFSDEEEKKEEEEDERRRQKIPKRPKLKTSS
jgi:hypothetical protein